MMTSYNNGVDSGNWDYPLPKMDNNNNINNKNSNQQQQHLEQQQQHIQLLQQYVQHQQQQLQQHQQMNFPDKSSSNSRNWNKDLSDQQQQQQQQREQQQQQQQHWQQQQQQQQLQQHQQMNFPDNSSSISRNRNNATIPSMDLNQPSKHKLSPSSTRSPAQPSKRYKTAIGGRPSTNTSSSVQASYVTSFESVPTSDTFTASQLSTSSSNATSQDTGDDLSNSTAVPTVPTSTSRYPDFTFDGGTNQRKVDETVLKKQIERLMGGILNDIEESDATVTKTSHLLGHFKQCSRVGWNVATLTAVDLSSTRSLLEIQITNLLHRDFEFDSVFHLTSFLVACEGMPRGHRTIGQMRLDEDELTQLVNDEKRKVYASLDNKQKNAYATCAKVLNDYFEQLHNYSGSCSCINSTM